MALIKCEDCRKEISDKASACIHCGCPIILKRKCNECGKEINDNDKVCSSCGCPIEEIKTEEKIKNKKSFEELTKEEKQYVYLEYLKEAKEFTMGFSFGLLALIILLIFILPPALFLFADICIFFVLMQFIKSYAIKYYEQNVIDLSNIPKPKSKNNKNNNKLWLVIMIIGIILFLYSTIGMIATEDIYGSAIFVEVIGIIMFILGLKNK